MVNPKVVPLTRPKLLNPVGGDAEQPWEFRFTVTWETLLAFPQPVEITEANPTAVVVAPVVVVAPLEIVPREIPAHALQVVEPPPRRPQPGDEAAWEMVVPKMERR
jgi:hypothetical protein